MRHHVLLLLLVLAGCAMPAGLDAERTTASLEGTREGYGVLRLLNDGEGATAAFLDVDVALDRRAANNLVAHRDGPDGVFGTRDDDLFDTIAEVDDIPYVGPVALARLTEFAQLNDYVPAEDDLLGTFDGVDFTYGEGERVLTFVNAASDAELADASVPSRAITSIGAARPIATVATLADLYWVGTRTLEHLIEAVAVPSGRDLCMSTDDCAAGSRCEGHPPGFDYGKCADTTSYPGIQEPCDEDAQCAPNLICIAQTVYEQGYCASAWMRDTFEVDGVTSIPAVAMTEPMAFPIWVYGQASVPEDFIIDLAIEHSDPSSLWVGILPPTGQEAVTLWDGATMTGPMPSHFVDRSIYRDDAVNGQYQLLVQNVGGRGEGELRGFTLLVTSRYD